MALRRFVHKITKSTEEVDREKLEAFCESCGTAPIAELAPRRVGRVAGEIRSVRIVPRAGAAAVEATISDGGGSVVAVFLGRRRVGGINTGRRIVIEGMVARDGARCLIVNPLYELR